MRLIWNTTLVAALVAGVPVFAQDLPAAAAVAAPSPTLATQGRLLEATLPVTGARTFTFSILDSAGAELWNSGAQSVSVNSGLYGVALGAAPMPAIATSVLAQANLKLHVVVSGVALAPDTELVPALQARSAFEVSGTFAGDIGGTQNAITLLRLQGIPLDLTTTAPTSGQGLVYNGTKWVPGTVSGAIGPQGPAGATGAVGAAGATGAQGLPGATGAAGATGVAGAQGPAGTNGRTTLSGVSAPTAAQGVDGDFYLHTATSTLYGPKGSVTAGQWPATGTSLVGAPGVAGAAGAAGTQGPVGLTGATGAAGVNGTVGLQGPIGATGAAGATGATGAAGPVGPVGMTYVGPWDVTVHYLANDVVTTGGSTYIALSSNFNAPPPGSQFGFNWSRIADGGAAGTAGATGPVGPAGPVGMTYVGPWDATVHYLANDVVTTGGSTYIALSSNFNAPPPGSQFGL